MRVIVIILATLVAQGYSQRSCYICENCNDPFDSNDHERVQCSLDNIFPSPGPPGTPAPTPPQTPPPTTSPPLTPPGETQPPGESPPPQGPPADGPPTTTLFPPTSVGDVALLRRRRDISPYQQEEPEPAQEPFRCFIAHLDVAGNRQTRRGCTSYIGEDTCAALGVTGDNCRICNHDGCNSGTRFALSILTLIVALFIAIRLH
uniref:Uncharacterized protein n=1 Tax=Nyssomyia neivai TaxID=330878 RepID=A0A1L8D9S9_9DIPT